MVLERSRGGSQSDSCLGELELKCLALQKQVDEMEVGTDCFEVLKCVVALMKPILIIGVQMDIFG